jgi:hypothetical protein
MSEGGRTTNPEGTPSQLAAHTAKWAVTMTKVRIRQAVTKTPFPHWHLLTFSGRKAESRGVVDLIAIRKDHGPPRNGLKRGDAFQIVLIQVKGGQAAGPTAEDARRLNIVAGRYGARRVLLAAWKKGKAPRFFFLHPKSGFWKEVANLSAVFR